MTDQEQMPKEIPSLDKEKDAESASQNTLFVSSLPYDATSEDLLAFFSDIGPIRSCFVVSKKNDASDETDIASTGNNAGYGYVHFAVPEDAARAIKELKKKKFQDKRTLRIQFALRKKIVQERKKGIVWILILELISWQMVCQYKMCHPKHQKKSSTRKNLHHQHFNHL